MAEHRPTAIVLLAFAVSLGALAVASASAFVRCGRESDCSYELALSIFAFAPAALIAGVVFLLMRARAELRWLQTGLLIIAVGLAIAPLAAFVLRDARLVPAFAALVAALVFLLIVAEREAFRGGVEGLPAPSEAEEPPAMPEPEAQPVEEAPQLRRPVRPRVGGALSLLEQMAALNGEIVRLCEALPNASGGRPDITHGVGSSLS